MDNAKLRVGWYWRGRRHNSREQPEFTDENEIRSTERRLRDPLQQQLVVALAGFQGG